MSNASLNAFPRIPLARDERSGRVLYWEPEVQPHLAIAGLHGAGKSSLLMVLGAGAVQAGFDVRLHETGDAPTELSPIVTPDLYAIEVVFAQMNTTIGLLRDRGLSDIRQLPVRERPRQTVLLIDEFGRLDAAQQRLVGVLMMRGRALGVHVVVAGRDIGVSVMTADVLQYVFAALVVGRVPFGTAVALGVTADLSDASCGYVWSQYVERSFRVLPATASALRERLSDFI